MKPLPHIVVILLVIVTAVFGLIEPDAYAGFMSPLHHQESRGQDAISLFVAIPLLMIGLAGAARAPRRWALFSGASYGYLLYVYLLYALGGVMNPGFPAYLAVAALSLRGLLRVLRLRDQDGPTRSSVRPRTLVFVAVVFLVFALTLTVLWGAILLQALRDAVPPDALIIIVFDFTAVIPAYIAVSSRLFSGSLRGNLEAGILALFSAVLGASILTGQLFAMAHGQHAGFGAVLYFAGFTVLSLLAFALLRHRSSFGPGAESASR